MIEDSGAGLALEHLKIVMPEDARDRQDSVASSAIEMIVMLAHELEAGASICQHELAHDRSGSKLLRSAEHRGEIDRVAAPREPGMELFERPGVTPALTHEAQHRGRDARLACHRENL